MLVSSGVWGLFWLPLRHLEDSGVDGVWSAFLLNMPVALVLAVVVALRWDVNRAEFRHAAAIGSVVGLGMGLYAAGLIYSTVLRATFLFYLVPVWATLIGIVWLDEKAGLLRWAAIAVGLGGLLLIIGQGGGQVPMGIGDVFAFFSGIFWAIGAAMIKRFDTVRVEGMALFQFLAAGFSALLLGAVAGVIGPPDLSAMIAGLPVAAATSILALGPSVIAIFWAQKFLFPGRAGLLMMSEVLVAALSASILLPGERMQGLEWVGAGLIVVACLAEVLLAPSDKPHGN